jgi:AcrR family transcriptional regulator
VDSRVYYCAVTAKRTDGRIERGNQTREAIMRLAVQIASVEGLENLSLGRLATDLNISKSGVFALFGSKDELQLATIRAANSIYVEYIVKPIHELPPGIVQVWRLCERWLTYSRTRVFPGGCFFFAVSAEYDARTGAVHDVIAEMQKHWTRYITQVLDDARAAGQLAAHGDLDRLAFELIALLETANSLSVLHHDDAVYRTAGASILDRLCAAAVDPALLPAELPPDFAVGVEDPASAAEDAISLFRLDTSQVETDQASNDSLPLPGATA